MSASSLQFLGREGLPWHICAHIAHHTTHRLRRTVYGFLAGGLAALVLMREL